jgi:hypothetical protein
MARGVDLTVPAPDIADHVDVEGLKQRSWRLETPCGVMVAGDDHGRHPRPGSTEVRERVVEELLGFPRWVLAVKNIACDDERIDLTLSYDLTQTIEHLSVLVLTREAAKGLTDVPVAGMQDADHARPPATLLSSDLVISLKQPFRLEFHKASSDGHPLEPGHPAAFSNAPGQVPSERTTHEQNTRSGGESCANYVPWRFWEWSGTNREFISSH